MTPTFPDWQILGHHYFPLGVSMRHEFGCAVWKVSVDAGFSCPNTASGGCIFCNISSFAPSRRLTSEYSLLEQLDFGIRQLQRHYGGKAEKFIAYFQPSTNTFAPTDQLEQLYRTVLSHPKIVGLAIGTRPDVLPDEVLTLLETLSQHTWVQLEIGLQSIHQKSLVFLNRGHDYPVFLDAFQRAKKHRLRLGIHLILGLPTEDRNDLLMTAKEIARLKPDCLKLHNLYVVRDTRLVEIWQRGELRLPSLEEYASMVVDFLEMLPPEIVIERISSETDRNYLLAPVWTGIKHAARNAIDQEFRHRNTFQGYAYF